MALDILFQLTHKPVSHLELQTGVVEVAPHEIKKLSPQARQIYSSGIATCVGVAAYSASQQSGFVAHATVNELEKLERLVELALELAPLAHGTKIAIIGGRKILTEFDERTVELIDGYDRELRKAHYDIVRSGYPTFGVRKITLFNEGTLIVSNGARIEDVVSLL